MKQPYPTTSGNPEVLLKKDLSSLHIVDFDSIKLKVASPDDIQAWSYGEITKPETINYRTQKAEKDGLFSERIFGPTRDYECSCGKYKRIRYKGIVCDKCHVEVTRSIVRRERMGHIELAVPVAHIWFLRNVPSRIGMILDKSIQEIEKVVYYSSYIITEVSDDIKKDYAKQIDTEYKKKIKEVGAKAEVDSTTLEELKMSRDKNMELLTMIKKWNIISEVEFKLMSFKFAPVFRADTGSQVIRDIFIGLDLDEELKRLEAAAEGVEGIKAAKLIKKMRFLGGLKKAKVRPEWMFLTKIPVIPPDLRPMVALDGGRFATSDLNDLYRRVINRNNRLKKFIDRDAPGAIIRNEKRMLQEAIDALIDNSMRRGQTTVTASTGQKRALKSLADVLKGKQGRFRQNLLGKRVDYSGRSVIVVGPTLKIDECGIPKEMALELFKPFIIHRLIEDELAHNIRSASRLIEQRLDTVWDILDEIIKHKYVLLNRAPTLHRLSIQAFRPVLIEGKAIQLHPMVCSPFNADFDGDQMAVHIPLSDESVKEAGQLMLSSKNLLKPSSGEPATVPSHDMVLGIYYVTLEDPIKEGSKMPVYDSFNDVVQAYDYDLIGLKQLVEVRKESKVHNQKIVTTVGRILFNEILPTEFPFINNVIDKKGLKGLLSRALELFEQEVVGVFLDKIKDFGFKYATKSGISWGMGDFDIPETRAAIIHEAEKKVDKVYAQYNDGLLTDKERYVQVVEVWTKTVAKVGDFVKSNITKDGPVHAMVASGARGTFGQLSQMVGMKGVVVNPSGNVIEVPIKSSFYEGLNELEYFISTHGARKGLVDTALKTAASGYLTRRLCDVCQDVVIKKEQCNDTEGVILYRSDAEAVEETFENFLFGRTSMQEIKNAEGKVIIKANDYVTREVAKEIDTLDLTEIRVRSVITCTTSRGLCQKCYGYDLGRNDIVKIGEAVGIVTAQAIGEPGTQLTMRTFHFGGVADAADVTKGLPRVEEVFEARNPKLKSIISEVDGTVLDISEKTGQTIIRVRATIKSKDKELDVREYAVDASINVIVSAGEKVEIGQKLTEGHVNLQELYTLAGITNLSRYIVREILDIYIKQGAGISSKHVELIIRQMTSRYHVLDGGHSEFLKGETITRDQLNDYNNGRQDGQAPIKALPLLLGITKVSLNTESFLSAASFQETTKVLIDAALFGKEDKLRGLKENVIIGKLIPAGTGFKADFIEKN